MAINEQALGPNYRLKAAKLGQPYYINPITTAAPKLPAEDRPILASIDSYTAERVITSISYSAAMKLYQITYDTGATAIINAGPEVTIHNYVEGACIVQRSVTSSGVTDTVYSTLDSVNYTPCGDLYVHAAPTAGSDYQPYGASCSADNNVDPGDLDWRDLLGATEYSGYYAIRPRTVSATLSDLRKNTLVYQDIRNILLQSINGGVWPIPTYYGSEEDDLADQITTAYTEAVVPLNTDKLNAFTTEVIVPLRMQYATQAHANLLWLMSAPFTLEELQNKFYLSNFDEAVVEGYTNNLVLTVRPCRWDIVGIDNIVSVSYDAYGGGSMGEYITTEATGGDEDQEGTGTGEGETIPGWPVQITTTPPTNSSAPYVAVLRMQHAVLTVEDVISLPYIELRFSSIKEGTAPRVFTYVPPLRFDASLKLSAEATEPFIRWLLAAYASAYGPLGFVSWKFTTKPLPIYNGTYEVQHFEPGLMESIFVSLAAANHMSPVTYINTEEEAWKATLTPPPSVTSIAPNTRIPRVRLKFYAQFLDIALITGKFKIAKSDTYAVADDAPDNITIHHTFGRAAPANYAHPASPYSAYYTHVEESDTYPVSLKRSWAPMKQGTTPGTFVYIVPPYTLNNALEVRRDSVKRLSTIHGASMYVSPEEIDTSDYFIAKASIGTPTYGVAEKYPVHKVVQYRSQLASVTGTMLGVNVLKSTAFIGPTDTTQNLYWLETSVIPMDDRATQLSSVNWADVAVNSQAMLYESIVGAHALRTESYPSWVIKEYLYGNPDNPVYERSGPVVPRVPLVDDICVRFTGYVNPYSSITAHIVLGTEARNTTHKWYADTFTLWATHGVVTETIITHPDLPGVYTEVSYSIPFKWYLNNQLVYTKTVKVYVDVPLSAEYIAGDQYLGTVLEVQGLSDTPIDTVVAELSDSLVAFFTP